MKKVFLIFCVMFLAIGLTACKKTKSPQGQVTTNGVATQQETKESYEGTIFDLLKKGKSLKCSYSQTEGTEKFKGIVYISGDKSRSDFEMISVGEGKMEGHTITDGTWVYSWSSLMKQGTKMKIEEIQQQETQAQTQTQEQKDYSNNVSQNMKYDCDRWSVDESMFAPPADINFIDMSELLEKTLESFKELAPSDNMDACATCDNINIESARDQCKKSLNCN